METIFTIGHSTRSIDEFIRILEAHEITMIGDVRTIPRSRTNPQFNRDSLRGSLQPAEIGYTYFGGLGGLRRVTGEATNLAWRNASFRGYADYMQTPEFEENLNELIEHSRNERIAIMCAEAVPWRCHRSLIGDALLVRGIPVEDIMSEKVRKPHTLTRFAKVSGTRVTYPQQPDEQQNI